VQQSLQIVNDGLIESIKLAAFIGGEFAIAWKGLE
jgi:hypothetical protein